MKFINNARRLSIQIRYSSHMKDGVRNAQAAEVFRAAFLDASRANTRISVTDLDELVVAEKVRPSLLLPAFEIAGTALGLTARFIPSKEYSTFIATTVHEATIQQFNDIVRDMHLEHEVNEDTKETLKYHRDLETDHNTQSTTTEEHHPHKPHHSDPSHTHNSDPKKVDVDQLAATTILYNVLKVARTL